MFGGWLRAFEASHLASATAGAAPAPASNSLRLSSIIVAPSLRSAKSGHATVYPESASVVSKPGPRTRHGTASAEPRSWYSVLAVKSSLVFGCLLLLCGSARPARMRFHRAPGAGRKWPRCGMAHVWPPTSTCRPETDLGWPPNHCEEAKEAGPIALLDNAGWFDIFRPSALEDFMALRGQHNRVIGDFPE